MKRVLITGGAGFIGSNLAMELSRRGISVVVTDRDVIKKSINLKGYKGEFYSLDSQKISELSGPFDVIFHHGDITDPRHGNDEEVLESNLAGFRAVVDFALRCKAKLVYASTAGLYGNGPTPMHEDQPKELVTAYAKSKWMMDEMAQQKAAELPIVGLRYFNVFGPRESQKGRPASMVFHLGQIMKEGRRPRLFNYGEHRRDFIYVKDVVRANLLAVDAPSGVYNVGTGVGTTFNELVACLNRALATDLPIEYFEMPYDTNTYQHHTQADTKRAESILKFKAEWNLQDAVNDYLEWLDS